VCLDGIFTTPLHVWNKHSKALLTLAPAPGDSATLSLGEAVGADEDPNQYESDVGGVSVVDSFNVEIYGLTIEGLWSTGEDFAPTGVLVTARSDVGPKGPPSAHRSACYSTSYGCGSVYVIDNTITNIVNRADELPSSDKYCGDASVGAYGIAVLDAGAAGVDPLQHVVVEDNNVHDTRTGQSETVTVNGNVTDFLVAHNLVHDADNIGIAAIGWELGTGQASHGLVVDNTVYDVDTLTNASYGSWRNGACRPNPENAAGIYTDGAKYVWIANNQVWNTDQGINLDVETPHRSTADLLVSGNVVRDDPGTTVASPSSGSVPPGQTGSSVDAGHSFVAFYVDAFGTGATISDVFATDNTFTNESDFYLQESDGAPVVDFGGKWQHVEFWHNQITQGPKNTLMEIDTWPSASAAIDCNEFVPAPGASSATPNGSYADPTGSWTSLAAWQRDNGHGWDQHSALGVFDPGCLAVPLAQPH
jgi:hypothetical protein